MVPICNWYPAPPYQIVCFPTLFCLSQLSIISKRACFLVFVMHLFSSVHALWTSLFHHDRFLSYYTLSVLSLGSAFISSYSISTPPLFWFSVSSIAFLPSLQQTKDLDIWHDRKVWGYMGHNLSGIFFQMW